MVEFAYAWVLTTLVLLLPLYYYLTRVKRLPALRFGNLDLFGVAPNPDRRNAQSWLLTGLELLIAAVLIVALARPRIGNEKLLVRAEGIDMIMVLDLSGSMAAYDVPNDIRTMRNLEQAIADGKVENRLAVAKTELSRFVAARPNDRIGLIGFAELPFALAPPTLDHDWLTLSLSTLQPGVIGDGTGIAGAISAGVRRLAEADSPRRVLLLFTDGSNNVALRLTPEQAAELAKAKNVVIYTVGIGSANAYYPTQDLFGNTRLAPYQNEFDEPLLKELAQVTGGRYFRAADGTELAHVMDEINALEKTNAEQPRYIEYREFAPALCGAAMVLMLLLIALQNTYCRTNP